MDPFPKLSKPINKVKKLHIPAELMEDDEQDEKRFLMKIKDQGGLNDAKFDFVIRALNYIMC